MVSPIIELYSNDNPNRANDLPDDDDYLIDAESVRNERLFILHAPLWLVQLGGIQFYDLPHLNIPRSPRSPTRLLIRYERDVDDPLYNPYDLKYQQYVLIFTYHLHHHNNNN